MRRILKIATLLGCFALASFLVVLFLRQNRTAPPKSAQTGEPPIKSETVSHTFATSAPTSASADAAPHRLKRKSPASSHNWEKALVLQERIEKPNTANFGQTLRHRIVKDDGFSYPIRITDRVEIDDQGTHRKLAEVSAYAANQVILHSSTALATPDVKAIAEALGWDYLEAESASFVAVLQARDAGLETVAEALAALELAELPFEAEPNHIFYASLSPDDAKYASGGQWNLHSVGDIDIDAPEGWDKRSSASNVTLAIVDTGIRLNHEDLLANLWVNSADSTYNGSDDDNNGYVDDVHGLNGIDPHAAPEDDNGHGTHVAGIAGAVGNNGKGVAGVAWRIQLMAIKALNADGKGATSNLVKAIDYAVANGADIINASWGSDSDSGAIERAIERAENEGVFFVVAAGNEQSEYLSFPARSSLANVISVGSVNESGELSAFSNYNATEVDLLAPGDNVISTWRNAPNAYSTQSGTSMAAPLVSGILALAIAEFPDDDLPTQKQRLVLSSEKYETLSFASVSGGIVNLKNALDLEHVPFPPTLLQTSSQSLTVFEGSPVKLWAKAESALPLTYKWYRNDQLLDESKPELSIPSVAPEQAGSYRLDIANQDASISVVFKLVVRPRMTQIEELLGNRITIFGSDLQHWELVEIDGEKLITNRALPEKTKAFLTFQSPNPGLLRFEGRREEDPKNQYRTRLRGPGIIASIHHQYWESFDILSEAEDGFASTIEHSNESYPGPTDSYILYLRIPRFFESDKLPPIFQENLVSQIHPLGRVAFFRVQSDQDNLSFQWYKDGEPIEGETGNVLTFTVTSAEAAGEYYVIATNAYGSRKSSSAWLEVDPSPQPARVTYEGEDRLTIVAGEPFSIPMSVFGAEPISYQWYRNDRPIPGATSRELDIGLASPAHSGTYYLKVENELSYTPQESARVQVDVSEQIFSPRFSKRNQADRTIVIAEGQRLVSTLDDIAGSHPMNFVWFKDGAPRYDLPSSPHLDIDAVDAEDAGVYYLEARNSLGTDQSGRVTVQVTPPIAEALDIQDLRLLSDLPKTETQPYIINQSAETWDGADALEIYLGHSGSRTIEFDAIGKDVLLRFRWKSSAGDALEFSYRNARYVWEEFHTDGSWKEEIILISGDRPLEFRFEPHATDAKVWLDDFEIIHAPHVLQQVSYTVPRVGRRVVLRAKALGDDLSYQWFKDSESLSGQTASSLTIDSYSTANAGEYWLEISNDHGATTTSHAEVGADVLNTIVQNGINPTFTGAAETRILALSDEGQSAAILVESDDQELWGFECEITGPVALEMRYALDSAICLLAIDETQVQIPGSASDASPYKSFIPDGTHTVRLSVDPSTIPFSGQVHDIRLRKGPIVTLKPSLEIHYNEPTVPLAEYAGAGPLTLKWYKDGELLSTHTNVSSGSSYPYNRPSALHDHGEYHLEIIDRDGLTAVSEKVSFSQMQKLAQAIDFGEGHIALYDQAFTRAYFDQQIKKSGSTSLALEGPFHRGESSAIGFNVRAAYATFQIRAQGFPEGSVIRYFHDGAQLELATSVDWQEVIVQTQDGRFFLEVPEGNAGSTLWIDQMTTSNKAVFTQQPHSITTYIGARVVFEARASFGRAFSTLQLTWLKDGREIDSEGWASLPIESVSKEHLGEYVARATSPEGDVIYSKPATLSLTKAELSSAIGYPGARITTYGSGPWEVDYEDSMDGPSSIISSPLEPGGFTNIFIEIDDAAAWGVYAYTLSDYNPDYIDTALDNKWLFHNAYLDYNSATQKVTLSVSEFGNESAMNRRLRVDGVRVTRFGSAHYDTWIKERTAGISTSSSNQDRTSDLDSDGIPNWLEFTLNLDPTKSGPLPPTGVASAGANETELVFRFFAARSGDYTITYETSYDLTTWESARPILETVSSTNEYDEVKATVKADPNRGSPFFVRWTIHNLVDNSHGTLSVR